MNKGYVEDREAVRLWLQHRVEMQGLNMASLARSLRLTRAAVQNWIRHDIPVPPKYWEGISAFFEYDDTAALIAAARTFVIATTTATGGRRRTRAAAR